MTTFTVMKTTFQEESYIPHYAVDSFREAFDAALKQQTDVVYVENAQLVKIMADGTRVIVKDLSNAYVKPKLSRSVLKRQKNTVSMA